MRKFWIELRSSLWFVPAVLVVLAIVAALGLVEVDLVFAKSLRDQSWKPLLNAGAEGARGMLTAIASSMITVVGVSFSVTIVTLSLASTQYTPRILRNFMRDRANQFVLGIFVAIYTYCLIVLRTIRSGSETAGGFVPFVAVGVALLLALLSVGCLIFFIHHIATSIQASSILQSITQETVAAIEVIFPEEISDDESAEEPVRHADWHPIRAVENGYLQHINTAALQRFAEENKTVVRLERRPGDFATANAPLVSTEHRLEENTHEALRAVFAVGDFRTVEQDAAFGLRQIVDIAMKALSPGVNDTSTAVSCLDYLGAILCRLARRRLTAADRGAEGGWRVLAPVPDWADFLAKSFDEIRLCAPGNVTILLQMLEVIRRIASLGLCASRRDALRAHAGYIVELADHSVAAPYDRGRVNEKLEIVRAVLSATAATLPPLNPRRTAEEWS